VRLVLLLWQLLRASIIAALFVGGACTWYALFSSTGATVTLALLEELSGGAIRADWAHGPLRGPLTVSGFVYQDRSVRLHIDHVRIEWRAHKLLQRTLAVDEVIAGTVRLDLLPSDEPSPPSAAPRLPLPLRARAVTLDALQLRTAPDDAPLVFERIRLSADWIGTDIHVRGLALHYAPVGAVSLTGRLGLGARELTLHDLRTEGLATAVVDGLIGYDDRVQLKAQWQALQWPPAGEPLLSSSGGAVEIDGHWGDFTYRLQAATELAPMAGLASTMEAQGRGSIRGLKFERLQIATLGGRLQGQGTLDWLPQPALVLAGDFADLDPSALAEPWPGRLGGRFALDFDSLAPLRGRAEVRLDPASQLRGRQFQLDLDARTAEGALALRQFDLRSGGSRLQLSGPLQPQLDASGQLDSADLGELWPGLGGTARARLRLRGNRVQPHIVVDAQLSELTYGETGARDARLAINLDANGPSQFRLELQGVRAGLYVERAMLSGTGTVADNRFDFFARSAVGDLTMSFSGAADLRALQWRGRLRSGHGEPARLSTWRLQEPADFSLGLQGFLLAPACWSSHDSRACAQANVTATQQRAAFRLENLDFGYFEPLAPPGWSVSGQLSGRGRVRREDGLLRAEADLQTSAGVIAIAGNEVLRFAPSRWLAEETARGFVSQLSVPVLEDGADRPGSAGLFWDALLSPAADWSQRRWSGDLRVDLSSLQPLRLFSPELQSVSGTVHGGFAISGSAGAPRLDGTLNLRDGLLRLATPGIELTGVSAQMKAGAGSSRISLQAAATSGGGQLSLEGSADLARFGDSLQLDLQGENFQVAATERAQVWVTPRLTFQLDGRKADLSGEVLVPRADIRLERLDRGVAPSADQIIIEPSGEERGGGLLQIHTRVRIGLGEEVRFRGLGLSTRLAGALQAFDQPGRPTTARGEVRLEEGRYQAYGQDLNIKTGRLIFNGGPVTQPAVDIRAERQPTEEVTVGLHVRGRLTAPEFSLYSTPAMPQDQQLAWLVLGRPLQEGGSGAERSALGGAALSLGLSGSNFIANKLRGGLRLDEISIGSRPGESPDQAQLTFGKYLSPKLFVSYGVGLFQPGQAFRLLYDIGRGFKLRTESGVESSGDLVYTIETD
jgi:translocation and assembly module TamB